MSNARESGKPIVDYEGALQRLGGDRKLFHDLVQFYWDDSPPLLTAIQNALQEQNAAEVERAVHSLKGLSSNFGAAELVRCAGEMEELAHAGDLQRIDERLHDLERHAENLAIALRDYCPQNP